MAGIIDIDTQIIGYPCYKPIIRALNSPAQIPEYERFIFGISRTEHTLDEEAINILDHLMQSCVTDTCAVFGANLYEMPEKTIGKKDVPSYILSQSRIPTHKLCTSYYQKYQPSLNACLACRRSPLYCNRYLKEELSILKYMLSEEENCKYIENKAAELDITFLGVFDILYDFFCKKSIYMPLNQLVFTYISDHDSTIFFESMVKDPNERLDLFTRCFTEDFNRMKDIPTEFATKYGLQKAIIQRQMERIRKSSDFTRVDIDELLKTISAYQKERIKTIEEFENLPLSQKSTFISYASKPKTDNTKKKDDSKPVQSYLNLSFAIYSDVKEAEKQPDKKNGTISQEKEETEGKTKEHTPEQTSEALPSCDSEKAQTAEDNSTPAEPSFTLCLYNTEKQMLSADDPVFRYTKEDLIPYREIQTLMDHSIPMEFSPDKKELALFRPINGNLITLAEMEDAALRDRCIAVEAVHSPNGFTLLLFTSTRHLFLCSDMQNKTEIQIIGQLLKKNGLKKVCYLPYLLYAFCYEKGLAVNGVHSILTQQAFLHPNSSSYGLRDLILENVEVNKEYIRSTLEKTSTLLYDSIRHYKKVFRSQERQRKNHKSHMLSSMEEFDKALGCSYLLGGCMNTETRLFVRQSGYQFAFHNNEYLKLRKTVRFSGYFATYEFDIHTKHAVHITTSYLCNLTKMNIIGGYNILIVSLEKNRTVFFIAKEEFDYLDAVITTSIRSAASQYGHPLLKISVIYEYHKAKT